MDPLGEILVRAGKLRSPDLKRVLTLQKPGESLAELLPRLGLAAERDVATGLSRLLGMPILDPHDYPDFAVPRIELSRRFLKSACVVPIGESEGQIAIAMADPRRQYALDAVKVACGKPVKPCLGLPSDIEAAIERCYGTGRSAIGQLVDDAGGADDDAELDAERLRDLASEAPVVRLVNLLIQRAVASRASDIHIEPFEDRLTVRYRIDGVLREVEGPPVRLTAAVVSRIKLMAKLNIAERRLPQDGRIVLKVQGKEIDLRISCVPTLHGESVNMRILDKENLNLDFSTLGLNDSVREKLQSLLARPHGIVLVTGPTGSGKTTTLYAALERMNTSERKVITVEDPVEYQLAGINQIQVKPQIGLTFANALRSILRQDPDVIMIGEMRDVETAELAVQSALTGHVVLSTLHTNDAASGITRLLEMGIEDYLVSSTVNAILAQRLVRRLCQSCRVPAVATRKLLGDAEAASRLADRPRTLYEPGGCDECDGTGYAGRVAIVELLIVDNSVRQLIREHAEAGEIARVAYAAGMRTMYEDGLEKVFAGITTVDEVLRVTRES